LVFWPQRLLLNRSDAVATVSETTKELIAKHNLTKRPVRVVYNAAEDESEIKIPTARPTSAQRLVYMGSFMDYKNVEVLIKGMAELAGFELHLLSRISSERQIELESLVPNGATVVFHNGVTDHEYQELLTGAVALVSGSQDEGFGIPLVEAMNRGVPIVVSDIEIFREIGGEAGIYFNQNDPKSFAAAVMSISEDRAWLQRSIAGQKQALKFSWTKSAEALLETLKQI
jgi:glycosyltransferase involved in cell wall biosynthesis